MQFSLRSLALILLLSSSSSNALTQLNSHQSRDVKAQATSTGQENNEFVDMSAMGEHISTLQLNMLNKKQGEAEGQEHIEVSPSDEQMLQTNSNINSHMLSRHRLKLKADDEDDTDMMAYSATTAKETASTQDSTSTPDESSSIFGSGGAISEALAESDPSLKEDESKTKEQKEVDAKKKKEEEEKKKKLAEKKKKDEAERRLKEEKKRKEEEKKKKEDKVKQEKQEKEQLERQQHLLENFLDDDKQTQKENESNYFYIKNPKKGLSALADKNMHDQTEAETASDIISKSRKSLFQGMDGGLF